jgi:hypothetical protein
MPPRFSRRRAAVVVVVGIGAFRHAKHTVQMHFRRTFRRTVADISVGRHPVLGFPIGTCGLQWCGMMDNGKGKRVD